MKAVATTPKQSLAPMAPRLSPCSSCRQWEAVAAALLCVTAPPNPRQCFTSTDDWRLSRGDSR